MFTKTCFSEHTGDIVANPKLETLPRKHCCELKCDEVRLKHKFYPIRKNKLNSDFAMAKKCFFLFIM